MRRAPGYEIVAAIGVPAIRERSLALTRRIIDAAQGGRLSLNTPLDDPRARRVGDRRRAEQRAVADELIRRA
jgi:kynureninase